MAPSENAARVGRAIVFRVGGSLCHRFATLAAIIDKVLNWQRSEGITEETLLRGLRGVRCPDRGFGSMCSRIQAAEELPLPYASTFVFDHIPKTAGSTFLLSYLPQAFRPDELAVLPGTEEPNRKEMKRLMALPERELRRLKVIAGHHCGELRPYCPGVRWLTLVRDPVERAVSSYLHARFHPGTGVWSRQVKETGLGLVEYVEREWLLARSNELGRLQNLQARIVLGSDFEDVLIEDRAALGRLRSRYHLVGYTEAFELFLFLLHVNDGFPLVLFNRRLVRKERASFRATPDDLERVERVNRADRALYNLVRKEFDRRTAEALTPPQKGRYERYLRSLREFQDATGGQGGATALYEDV